MWSCRLFRTIFAYAHLPIRPTVQLGYTSYARSAAARTNETALGALSVVFVVVKWSRSSGHAMRGPTGRGSDTLEGAFFTALKFTYFKSIIGFGAQTGLC